jgi:proteasome regulatory subunit
MSEKNDQEKKYDVSKIKENPEYIITYTRHLEKRLRNLETEKQLLDAERLRLEQELHSLRNEIDRLREPPLVGAVVVHVVDENKGRYVIMSSTGPLFTVNASRKVKGKKIEPGTMVSLNQRTFAIMEVMDMKIKDWKKLKEKVLVTRFFLDTSEPNDKGCEKDTM